jgi:hypothetical protein
MPALSYANPPHHSDKQFAAVQPQHAAISMTHPALPITSL